MRGAALPGGFAPRGRAAGTGLGGPQRKEVSWLGSYLTADRSVRRNFLRSLAGTGDV